MWSGLVSAAIANMHGLANTVKHNLYVTMDTRVHNGFVVHRKDGSKETFSVDQLGLYVKDSDPLLKCINLYIDEFEGFTPREVRQAKQYKKLHHNLKAPSKEATKGLLQQNIVKNIPMTFEDAGLAEGIFRKYARLIKGKEKRPHPPVVRKEEEFHLPEELRIKYTELAADIIFIEDQAL